MRCLTRIPEMVSSHAVDPEPLIGPMIALLASNNAEVKRRVCDFLCIASEADEEVQNYTLYAHQLVLPIQAQYNLHLV